MQLLKLTFKFYYWQNYSRIAAGFKFDTTTTSSVVVISQPYSQANYFLMCDHQSLTEPSSAGLLNLLVVMAVKVFQIVNHLDSVKNT